MTSVSSFVSSPSCPFSSGRTFSASRSQRAALHLGSYIIYWKVNVKLWPSLSTQILFPILDTHRALNVGTDSWSVRWSKRWELCLKSTPEHQESDIFQPLQPRSPIWPSWHGVAQQNTQAEVLKHNGSCCCLPVPYKALLFNGALQLTVKQGGRDNKERGEKKQASPASVCRHCAIIEEITSSKSKGTLTCLCRAFRQQWEEDRTVYWLFR